MIFELISSLNFSNILSLSTILTVVYVSQFYFRHFTRPNPLPGPFPLPLVGNSLQVGHKFNDFLVAMHKKYGDMYEVFLADQRDVMLCTAGPCIYLQRKLYILLDFVRLKVSLNME